MKQSQGNVMWRWLRDVFRGFLPVRAYVGLLAGVAIGATLGDRLAAVVGGLIGWTAALLTLE